MTSGCSNITCERYTQRALNCCSRLDLQTPTPTSMNMQAYKLSQLLRGDLHGRIQVTSAGPVLAIAVTEHHCLQRTKYLLTLLCSRLRRRRSSLPAINRWSSTDYTTSLPQHSRICFCRFHTIHCLTICVILSWSQKSKIHLSGLHALQSTQYRDAILVLALYNWSFTYLLTYSAVFFR